MTEPLDQLTKWVVEKFSSVKNKHIPVPSFHGHPLTKNELMKQIFIKSVKKSRTLEITFPFPDQTAFYECQVRGMWIYYRRKGHYTKSAN